MRRITQFACLLASVLGITACQILQDQPSATAVIQPKSNSKLNGSVTFTQSGKNVLVSGIFSGLQPNAQQGIHIHEKGDCSAADATSAGGHFNPSNTPHGSIHQPKYHAGDMPNISSDQNGYANYRATLQRVSLVGELSIIGLSVVVHQDPDDYTSQPAGNSGPRVGCGLIR